MEGYGEEDNIKKIENQPNVTIGSPFIERSANKIGEETGY